LITQATLKLARDGFLLTEDVAPILDRALAHWDYATGTGR
jgi:hypothetical protein